MKDRDTAAMHRALTVTATLLVAAHVTLAGAAVNPYPREVIEARTVRRWPFDKEPAGWAAVNQCRIDVSGGVLTITATGRDPSLRSDVLDAAGRRFELVFRARCRSGGGGQVFWTTDTAAGMSEDRSARFMLTHDGTWREYRVPFRTGGRLRHLRLDPGAAPGTVEIRSMELRRRKYHPLEITRVEITGTHTLAVTVRNHGPAAATTAVCGETLAVPPGGTATARITVPAAEPFETVELCVTAADYPPLRRTLFIHNPAAAVAGPVLETRTITVRVAADGAGARIERNGRLAAFIFPIVYTGGRIPPLKVGRTNEGIAMAGGGLDVRLSAAGDEVAVSIDSRSVCEGPVLRVPGRLEQGLFAGLEYLGKGERSSSTLDIETAEHRRFAPDPLKVTMPLMACVTDGATAALTWEDMSLQPVFAAPNCFDGTADHRMALRGEKIRATICAGPAGPLEEAILWAVRKRGLPPLPEPPRTFAAQRDLALQALNGPLKGDGGWGHCAEKRWKRQPFAGHASTLFRLTGSVPDLPRLQRGGTHVPNEAAWFLTGRADRWLQLRRAEARGIEQQQQGDGSFRYSGRYRRGHFEDTASGLCARKAATLLAFARCSGDERARAAGLRTLDYMKRFRTPRGAQTWELSLHTPDILAAACLVQSYVRGWELTGKRDYLNEARRWALSGIPFVYLWGRYPVMRYATIPVYGATNWRAPVWFGLPVQWCGGVYAYALTQLAPHDRTLDWKKLAEGICIVGEQMIYPDGPLAGCLPDFFHLAARKRGGPSINPCAMISLRMVLEGTLDSLAVATGGGHRVVAPFPVTIDGNRARVTARKGVTYQVLIDGHRIETIVSGGTDEVALGE